MSNKKNNNTNYIDEDEKLLAAYLNPENNKTNLQNPVYTTSGNESLDKELSLNKSLATDTNNALKQTYENQIKALGQAQMQAEQAASISNERLMKYLGQQQQMSGLASGQRGTDYINATNNYMQNRANITQNYADKKANLLENYNKDVISNNATAAQNEIAILDKYRKIDIENQQNEREQKQYDNEEDADLSLAINNKINAMLKEYIDENGKITANENTLILNEIQKYKSKFKREENFEKLLDAYNTLMYGKVQPKTKLDDLEIDDYNKVPLNIY